MAARKNRPVLYEVVRRSQRQREHGWRGRLFSGKPEDDESQASETADESQLSREPAAQPAATAPIPPAHAMEPAPEPRETAGGEGAAVSAAPRTIRVAGDQLVITLTWPSGIAFAVGLVLLLVVAFTTGRRSVGSAPTTESTASTPISSPTQPRSGDALVDRPGRVGPAATPVPRAPRSPANVQLAPTVEPNAARAPVEEPLAPQARRSTTPLGPGRYLVIQDFTVQRDRSRRQRDAASAVAHLRARGIEAVVVDRPGRAPLVVAAQPLNDVSKAEVSRLKQRVAEAGRDFADYDFKGAYELDFP